MDTLSIGPFSGGEFLVQEGESPMQLDNIRPAPLPPATNDTNRVIKFLRATSIQNPAIQQSIQDIKNLNTFPHLKEVQLSFDDFNDSNDNEASIVLDDLWTTLEAEVPVLQQELDRVSIEYYPIKTNDGQFKKDLRGMLVKIAKKFPQAKEICVAPIVKHLAPIIKHEKEKQIESEALKIVRALKKQSNQKITLFISNLVHNSFD